MKKAKTIDIEKFESLFVGHPRDIEKNLKKLLPKAKSENMSIYLQILSRIALAQALQKKFKLAHQTLDKAEKLLTPDFPDAHARILLERGRVYHQSHNLKAALPLFFKSYEFSKKHKIIEHMSTAAHMIAFVTKNVNDKIKWNKKTIAICKQAKNPIVRGWLVVEYNNLGWAYAEAKKFREAFAAYKKSFELATQKKLEVIALGAKWGMARCMRLLNAADKALPIQLELLEKYNALHKKGILPIELLRVTRGKVYEELAEIYLERGKNFFRLAYDDLSKDPWTKKLEPKRLKKLKEYQKN